MQERHWEGLLPSSRPHSCHVKIVSRTAVSSRHCSEPSYQWGWEAQSTKKHSSLATGSCNYTQMNGAQPPQCYNTGFCSFVTFLFCSQPPSSVTWHAFIFSTDFCIGNFMTLLNRGLPEVWQLPEGLCSGFLALLVQHSTYARDFLHFLAFLIPCHPRAEGASWTLDGSHCQCRQAQCLSKATFNG